MDLLDRERRNIHFDDCAVLIIFPRDEPLRIHPWAYRLLLSEDQRSESLAEHFKPKRDIVN